MSEPYYRLLENGDVDYTSVFSLDASIYQNPEWEAQVNQAFYDKVNEAISYIADTPQGQDMLHEITANPNRTAPIVIGFNETAQDSAALYNPQTDRISVSIPALEQQRDPNVMRALGLKAPLSLWEALAHEMDHAARREVVQTLYAQGIEGRGCAESLAINRVDEMRLAAKLPLREDFYHLSVEAYPDTPPPSLPERSAFVKQNYEVMLMNKGCEVRIPSEVLEQAEALVSELEQKWGVSLPQEHGGDLTSGLPSEVNQPSAANDHVLPR